MRRVRTVLLLLFACLLAGGYFTLRALGIFTNTPMVKAVPRGDQEIAYIQTAVNGAGWERYVTGLRRLKQELPDLVIDESNAFPEQTAEVPELSLGFKGSPAKLWIRWYKVSSEAGIRDWVQELAGRDPPPLAITGLGSSDRARELAEVLREPHHWHGDAPLLLLDTATADEIYEQDPSTGHAVHASLMSLYPGRTFRFCFSNKQMAEAMRDFVWSHPDIWYINSVLPSLAGVPMAAGGDVWGSLSPLTLGGRLSLPDVRVMEWSDDPYSTDLGLQFRRAQDQPGFPASSVESYTLNYSVGCYYWPNRPEAKGIEKVLQDKATPDQRLLLVLPTGEKPARRVLHGLATAAPDDVRDVVALTGDAISFNVIYRDRNVAWNIQDMPVPLILFCHQNPVDWPEETGKSRGAAPRSASGTDDELLNADIARLLIQAAFKKEGGSERLVTGADELAARLGEARLGDAPAPFFSADGNRMGGSGEYIVCLKPTFRGGQVLPRATIEVWSRKPGAVWEPVGKPLAVEYDASRGGGGGHGGF
jgi:hypothetical protein